ncbi:MAG: hypothetical protein N4A31_01245 [Rickettsiales bacterium]|jgi:hypothetical protein|nr:hypothetical protein [Rickettsiales bacterium]
MAIKKITSEEYKEKLIKKGVDSESPLLNSKLENVHYLTFKNILAVEKGISKEKALEQALKFEWPNLRVYTWYNMVEKKGKLSVDEALMIKDESQFHDFRGFVNDGLSKSKAFNKLGFSVPDDSGVEMGGVGSFADAAEL